MRRLFVVSLLCLCLLWQYGHLLVKNQLFVLREITRGGLGSEQGLRAINNHSMTTKDASNDPDHVASPSQTRSRKKVIILSTFRGGSSFLGEIFNQNAKVLYWFEPLHRLYYRLQGAYRQYGEASSYKYREANGTYEQMPASYVRQLLEQLEAVLSCNLTGRTEDVLRDPFITWAEGTRRLISTNPCHFNATTAVKPKCAHHVRSGCFRYNYTAVKSLRLAVYMIESLISRDPDVKVIHYVRDPRGTINSRYHYSGDRPSARDYSQEAGLLCHMMADDYRHIRALSGTPRRRLMSVKYEDLILDPPRMARRIYDFIDLALPSSVETWLRKHTNTSSPGKFSTTRISRETAYRWKIELPKSIRNQVESICRSTLSLYGYRV